MSPPATSRSLPRLRWNWDFGPLLGDVDTSRLLQLLSALAEGGALGSAARASGMSYRSAWGLLRDCEQALGASMVVMERGRGTRLTEFGMALVDLDSAARRALEEVHAPWQRKLEALLAPVVRVAPERLRLAASHDLALADWIEHGRRIRFELFWRGSEEALAELGPRRVRDGRFPCAGKLGRANNSMPGCGAGSTRRAMSALPVMRRRQGLIVARGNPHQACRPWPMCRAAACAWSIANAARARAA
jgi:putative molybdopterin biosynthesis protein